MKFTRLALTLIDNNLLLLIVCAIISVCVVIFSGLIWLAPLPFFLLIGYAYLGVYGPLNHMVKHKLGALARNEMIEDSGLSPFDAYYRKEIGTKSIMTLGIGALGMHYKKCETGFTKNEVILRVVDMPFSNVYFIPWRNIARITEKSNQVEASFNVLVEYTRDVYFRNGQKISLPLSDDALSYFHENCSDIHGVIA